MAEIQPAQKQTSHYVYRSVSILLLPYFLFFFVFRFPRSLVRPLRDNRHFLFPIRKSDACNKLEKVWPQGSRKAACSVFWNFSKTRANGLRSDSDGRVAKTTGCALNSYQRYKAASRIAQH